MNIHLFQEYLMYAALGGSLALLVGLIGYFMRNELRKFHQWVMHMPMLGKVIVFTGLAIGIVHGSTKTNLNTQAASPHAAGERFDLPSTPSAALQAANPNRSQVQPLPLAPERNRLAFVTGSEGDGATTNRADCLSACAAGTCVSNWTTRGAFLDWTHISFPEGFSFPYGLERLSSVTLMSNGAVRSCLTNAAALAQLPLPVSVEPNVSSVTHGLTSSNSYLFAWHDACVNREATNRTDAAIELFADGRIVTRFRGGEDAAPTVVPEGFVGQGQDEDWIRGNFALLQEMDASLTNVTQILDVGYENWLRSWVGINEMNGRYQATVTIPEIPDGPCYFECGPWKMVLSEPGTYRFPLMVFEPYHTQGYPLGIPFHTDYDDGYRGFEESFAIEDVTPSVPAAAPAARARASLPSRWEGYDISTFRILKPMVVIKPGRITLTDDDVRRIELWTNMPVRHWMYESLIEGLHVVFNDYDVAELRSLRGAGAIKMMCIHGVNTSWGILTIDELNSIPFPGTEPIGRTDATLFEGETLYAGITNGYTHTHLTAVTATNSLDLVRETTTVNLPTNQSCFVAVYLASMEDALNPTNCFNDVVSWRVTANGQPDWSGRTSIYEQLDRLQSAYNLGNHLYGVCGFPIQLESRVYHPEPGQALHLNLEAMVQNIGDGLRETCLQIAVYPIDDLTIWGAPDWTTFEF